MNILKILGRVLKKWVWDLAIDFNKIMIPNTLLSNMRLQHPKRCFETPPQSPDLNPIDDMWWKLEQRIRKHNINSCAHLKRTLHEEWAKIPCSSTSMFVETLPRRLNAVAKAKGA